MLRANRLGHLEDFIIQLALTPVFIQFLIRCVYQTMTEINKIRIKNILQSVNSFIIFNLKKYICM